MIMHITTVHASLLNHSKTLILLQVLEFTVMMFIFIPVIYQTKTNSFSLELFKLEDLTLNFFFLFYNNFIIWSL